MVRFKNRWILVEFILVQGPPSGPSNQPTSIPIPLSNPTQKILDGKIVYNALKQSVLTNFGDTGWGAVGLSLTVKYFSPMTNMSIIRVARDTHNVAWGAVTLLTSIDGAKYIPNVVHVSGTIKHAQLAAIEHNRQIIARYRTLANNPTSYRDSYETYLQSSEREIQALQD